MRDKIRMDCVAMGEEIIEQESMSLGELTDAHQRWLRFLTSRVGDRATAEDILQSAYVKALEHGSELRDQESTVSWFYSILRNAIADHFRRNATRARAMEAFAAESIESYELELKNHACACVHDVIQHLKPDYRAAIETVDLAERSVEDFAGSQGITANNASVRLHRARKAVAKELASICGTCAEHKCIDCTCKKGVV